MQYQNHITPDTSEYQKRLAPIRELHETSKKKVTTHIQVMSMMLCQTAGEQTTGAATMVSLILKPLNKNANENNHQNNSTTYVCLIL